MRRRRVLCERMILWWCALWLEIGFCSHYMNRAAAICHYCTLCVWEYVQRLVNNNSSENKQKRKNQATERERESEKMREREFKYYRIFSCNLSFHRMTLCDDPLKCGTPVKLFKLAHISSERMKEKEIASERAKLSARSLCTHKMQGTK